MQPEAGPDLVEGSNRSEASGIGQHGYAELCQKSMRYLPTFVICIPSESHLLILQSLPAESKMACITSSSDFGFLLPPRNSAKCSKDFANSLTSKALELASDATAVNRASGLQAKCTLNLVGLEQDCSYLPPRRLGVSSSSMQRSVPFRWSEDY
ncbi:hypothetical protein Y1Q_0014579 [Alligator mississippiensis]|uniref:Uncharacterized protein n=1 Tax=Alligator mississippiensis TaxID=8496 RepID=A0A151PDC7_ALLMI|nr:hypothetical protein Y1Q_0014579 [Alligator mississippiensis]